MTLSRFLFIALLFIVSSARAEEHALTVSMGGATRTYTAEELLHNPATVTIKVPKDASYGRAMKYQALPLSMLFKGTRIPSDQVLQMTATDGFTAELSADFVRIPIKGAVALLAIEPPHHPWPKLPGKDASAGPFYIVWQNPEESLIRPEQWPYGVVKISAKDSPAKRWPAIAVGKDASPAARHGQDLFVTNCMVCHKMNGGGEAEVGPDLDLPKSPVEYFRKDALHAYIRDPSSQRSWKTMGMKGFGKDALSDGEIDAIIAYLDYMSAHKKP